MHFKWLNNRKPLVTSDKLPYHLRKYAVAFPQCRYEKYEEGETLAQVFLGMDFSIWLHHMIMDEDTMTNPTVENPILAINYMRLGIVQAKLYGSGPVLIKAGKCHMFYVPKGTEHEAILPKGVSSCLHINFHPNHLLPIANQYPQFQPMISQMMHMLSEGRQQVEVDITAEMEEQIDQILNCRFEPGEKEIFYQARIRDLLRMYCAAMARNQQIEAIRNPEERILAKMEFYIRQHLSKDLSLDTLAAEMNVGRTSLQKLVTKKFDTGVHEQVVKIRMEEAAERLLQTNKSVSAIAVETTDMTISAFSSAFRKYHRLTPTQYRKKHGKNRKK